MVTKKKKSIIVFFIVIFFFTKIKVPAQTFVTINDLTIKEDSVLIFFDDTVKSELAYFYKAIDTIKKHKVNEIPFTKCTSTSIRFEVRNILSTSLIVSINSAEFDTNNHSLVFEKRGQKLVSIDGKQYWGTNGSIPKKKVNFLRSSHGPHCEAKIPETALDGIYQPKFCGQGTIGNHTENCRLFLSEDKRRRYIYMRNGDPQNEYVVIWIIRNNYYYGRIIEKLH